MKTWLVRSATAIVIGIAAAVFAVGCGGGTDKGKGKVVDPHKDHKHDKDDHKDHKH